MTYSVIMPYFRRPDHLWNTLVSYRHHYRGRTDYEVLIVADPAGGHEDADALEAIMPCFRDIPCRVMESPAYGGVNPVIARNYAALGATGRYLVNTNPECFHRTNVLSQFDEILKGNAPKDWGPGHPLWNAPSAHNKYDAAVDCYIIPACENVEFKGRANEFKELEAAKHIQWYDHPHHNNRMLHWCTCLPRRLYMAIGGFDEQYHKHVGMDDDDFRTKIIALGIKVVQRQDIMVSHIDHERSHQDESKRAAALAYYREKWER